MTEIFWEDALPYPVLVLQHDPKIIATHWDEYVALIDRTYDMARSHDGYIYIIFDVAEANLPPGNAIKHLRYGFESAPDNVRAAYIITHNPVLRRFAEIAMRLLAKHPAIHKYHFVYNRADAQRRIRLQEGDIA